MLIFKRSLCIAALAAGSMVGCGNEPPRAHGPIELGGDEYCSLDGMMLADYPGPKAQVHFAQGEPELFCDTIEMFSMVLHPESTRAVTAIYVHDMSKSDWDRPAGGWIDARSAFYVIGSNRRGSMGPTLASFGEEAAATAFAAEHGGHVLRFDEVTPDMVTLDGGVLKDRHG